MLANETRYVVIQRTLLIVQRDQMRFRDAAGQRESNRRAPIADHHLGEPAMQFVYIARHQFIAAIHELFLERTRGAEQPRLQERDEVEQFFEIVLHRRRSQ